MADNIIGDLRRSTVVMTFGPGAVVDFRAEGAPVSAVTAGLEEWDRSFPPQGVLNPQAVYEPRLQRKLGVSGFRLPPVYLEDFSAARAGGPPDRRALVGVRFPDWLQCPVCDRIAPSKKWNSEPGRAYRFCSPCTSKSPGQRKVFAIPVRFVMACEAGHLDDFPWHFWVNHKKGCGQNRGFLRLSAIRPGLAGLILSCPECKEWRSMDGIFGKDTWKGFPCSGKRPWLTSSSDGCTEKQPRALQRGASNLYFPVMESAISIPPWSDRLQEAIGVYWNSIVSISDPGERRTFIKILSNNELKPVLQEFGLTYEKLAELIEERRVLFSGEEILDIRKEEYRQLTSRTDTRYDEDREFEIRNVSVPASLSPYFSHIVKAVRIREIRALRGFTRINPPGREDKTEIAPISEKKLDWLPAIEVRGEGIFLALNQTALAEWEKADNIRERAIAINTSWQSEWKERYGEGEAQPQITPRYLLVHSFAHALMRQLTLECGYSSAAMRERLYVGETMAGVLIYTATSDSDGTLGGLQRQGEPSRIERAVKSSLQSMAWCSSDPLCINGMNSAREMHSFAACHACLHAPETACEQFNRFLDRAMLIGLPGYSESGFFSSLFEGE